jgi:hypothetical protein
MQVKRLFWILNCPDPSAIEATQRASLAASTKRLLLKNKRLSFVRDEIW